MALLDGLVGETPGSQEVWVEDVYSFDRVQHPQSPRTADMEERKDMAGMVALGPSPSYSL